MKEIGKEGYYTRTPPETKMILSQFTTSFLDLVLTFTFRPQNEHQFQLNSPTGGCMLFGRSFPLSETQFLVLKEEPGLND